MARAHLHELRRPDAREPPNELRPKPAELSLHFYEARHSLGAQPALHYAREAADSAAGALAWEDAATQLERALELDGLPEPSDPDDRCELLLQLGEMRLRAGHPGFSDAFVQAGGARQGALEHATRPGRDPLRGALLRGRGGGPDADRAAARGARGVGTDEQDLRARLLARLAEILHFAGEWRARCRLPARRWRSRRTWATSTCWPTPSPATTCRCSTSVPEGPAGVERGADPDLEAR